MKKLKAAVFLGMNSWRHTEINDTVRFLTRAAATLEKLYINPPPGLKNTLKSKGRLAGAWRWQRSVADGIDIYNPPLGFAPVALGLRAKADRIAAKSFDRLLQSRYGAAWREQVLVYISSWSYTQTNFIRQLNPRYLVFHILDDALAFPMIQNDPRVLAENHKFFRYIIGRSSLVLAVSAELARKYGELYQREVAVVKNGVDVEHFCQSELAISAYASSSHKSPINEVAELPQPVLMYVGSINSWVDLGLLLELVNNRPHYSLVLIGHCYADTVDGEQWSELLRKPNVFWLKSKPYHQVPAYMQSAAVLLLPRTEAEHSRASDPLKLYEYLSAGKPVVSTSLPAVADFRELVYVARNAAEFIQQVDLALNQPDPERPQRQYAVVRQHSWSARVKEIGELLEKHLGVSWGT